MPNLILLIWFGFLRLILSFLHVAYSGLEYFDIAWALFKRKVEGIGQLYALDSQLYVSRFVTNLEKCPSHFAVIIGNDRINYEDFSNLVIWCIAAGISFVSFYDCTGYLKTNGNLYYKYLIEKRKLDPNYIICNVKMNCNQNGLKKNGYTKKIHVNILSIEDGKPLFVKLVEKLCKRALLNEIQSTDIDEKFIDEEMNKIFGFTDPELALVCGKMCGSFGFLPWHIRLTEFLQIPSVKNITVSDFTYILKKYSTSRQRFGR